MVSIWLISAQTAMQFQKQKDCAKTRMHVINKAFGSHKNDYEYKMAFLGVYTL